MEDSPILSIILPVFNRLSDLETTRKLIRKNVTLAHEIIMLDNSPNPLTPSPLQSNEHLVRMPTNLGAAARNHGAHLAVAPYVLMLDDDSHPTPGALEAAIKTLEQAPPHIAGLMATVTTSDGTPTSSLLPTVMIGCGALFRKQALVDAHAHYPEPFMFYGEEYALTLQLYAAGYKMIPDPQLRIVHRTSPNERSKSKIFYHLGRNNRHIWQTYTPSRWLPAALSESHQRYQITASHENVLDAYLEGIQNSLDFTLPHSPNGTCTPSQFESFALIDRMRQVTTLASEFSHAVLCGTGKFPGIWSHTLKSGGFRHVSITERHPAMLNHRFGTATVRPLDIILETAKPEALLFITGHTSAAENQYWQQHLTALKLPHRIDCMNSNLTEHDGSS